MRDPEPPDTPSPRPRSSERSRFRYCPACATPLQTVLRHGRTRPSCPRCGFVQWRNPVAGVAGVISEDSVVDCLGEAAVRSGLIDPSWIPAPGAGRVLLVRRAASHPGTWCFPCGYVEFDEEIREALQREIEEETGIAVRPGRLLAVHSNFHEPDSQSVGVWFEATPVGGAFRAGDDADGLGFFAPDAAGVPLAFPTDALVLRSLAQDGRSGGR